MFRSDRLTRRQSGERRQATRVEALIVAPRLKQRLVGAAVLLALAVIFLPMLLDGSGRDAGVSLREAIPPEPEFPRPEIAPPLALDGPPPAPAEETRPAPPREARNLPEPVPVPVPRSEPAAPERPAEPAPQPAPVQPPADAATSPGGFAVQVGSFGEEANARAESQRLSALGFAAFVEPARADGRALYRVKVGPVAERSEAERLRDRMKDQINLQGIVVAHP
jgi:DedD protein